MTMRQTQKTKLEKDLNLLLSRVRLKSGTPRAATRMQQPEYHGWKSVDWSLDISRLRRSPMFVVRRCNVVPAPAEPNVCPLRARSLAPACSLIDLKHTPPLEAGK
jgi:hypothetical protein